VGDIIVAVNPYKLLKIYEKEVRLGKWHAMKFGSILCIVKTTNSIPSHQNSYFHAKL